MKRRIRVFLHVFKHSLFPFDAYYTKVRKVHFSFSFFYFWTCIALLLVSAVLLKSTLFITLFPPSILKQAVQEADRSYPKDLVLTISSMGRLSTTIDYPYILFSPIDRNPRPLLVVDPKGHEDKVDQYEAIALLTERKMFIKYGGTTTDYHYPTGTLLRVDKATVKMISQTAQTILDSYWSFMVVIVLLAILIGIPAFGFSYLTTLFFATAIYYVILRIFIKHKRITFSSMYKVGLHAITGPLIIEAVAFVFGLAPSVPFWYTLLLYIFFAGALYETYFERKVSA